MMPRKLEEQASCMSPLCNGSNNRETSETIAEPTEHPDNLFLFSYADVENPFPDASDQSYTDETCPTTTAIMSNINI